MPESTDDWTIVDIDGTVSDCRHRQGFLDQETPDWEAFFSASETDPPLIEGVELARQFGENLMWLTGRPERFRAITERWLHAQGLPVRYLYMRPDDDMRPAVIFKADRVAQLAATRPISLIVDDDDDVVAALRAAGWPVQHVAWMAA